MMKKRGSILVAIATVVLLFGLIMTEVFAAEECTHDWSVAERNVETHTRVCTHCGEILTEEHTYPTAHKSFTYMSDDYHSQSCSVCGQVNLYAHTWESGLFNLWYWCDGCDTNASNKNYAGAYHGVIPEDCDTHTWVVKSYSTNGHILECHYCGMTIAGDHVWTRNSTGMLNCSAGCVAYIEGEDSPDAAAEYPIEYCYSQPGPYAVSAQEFSDFIDPENQFNHIKIWYPTEMTTATAQWPVIVFCNGTGSAYGPNQNGDTQTDEAGYTALFEHFASWGFILVANNRPGSASSTATDTTLRYLLDRNSTSGDLFYDKVDMTRIGIAGHSQGGTAVLQNLSGSTVTSDVNITYEHTDLYKAAWSASPQAHDNILKWTYTPENIETPTFMVCADNDWASSASILSTNISKMSDVETVMAVRKNADHGSMVSIGKGYMIAWFRYILMNDRYAAGAFESGGELFLNRTWQDQTAVVLPE